MHSLPEMLEELTSLGKSVGVSPIEAKQQHQLPDVCFRKRNRVG